jgi:hypothetical protein
VTAGGGKILKELEGLPGGRALYDLLKPHVTKLVVCDPRMNSRQGNKNDRIDARELSDRLYMNKLSSVTAEQASAR